MNDKSHKGGNRGRWQKGRSGNPKGRPKKVKSPPPTDLVGLLFQALDVEVQVNQNGKPKSMMAREAFAVSMVKEMLNAKGIDKLRFFNALLKFSKDNPNQSSTEKSQAFWTEAAEELYQEILAHEASQVANEHEAGMAPEA